MFKKISENDKVKCEMVLSDRNLYFFNVKIILPEMIQMNETR